MAVNDVFLEAANRCVDHVFAGIEVQGGDRVVVEHDIFGRSQEFSRFLPVSLTRGVGYQLVIGGAGVGSEILLVFRPENVEKRVRRVVVTDPREPHHVPVVPKVAGVEKVLPLAFLDGCIDTMCRLLRRR